MLTAHVQRLIAPRSFVDAYLRPRIASDKALYDSQKGHYAYVFAMELASGLFALLLDLPYNALTGGLNALYDGLRRRKFSADYFYQHFNLAWRSSSTALRTLLLQPIWGRTSFTAQLPCVRELAVTFTSIQKNSSLRELIAEYRQLTRELPIGSAVKIARLCELLDFTVARLKSDPASLSVGEIHFLTDCFQQIPHQSFWYALQNSKHLALLVQFYFAEKHRANEKFAEKLQAFEQLVPTITARQLTAEKCLALFKRYPLAIATYQDALEVLHSWIGLGQFFGSKEVVDEVFEALDCRAKELSWSFYFNRRWVRWWYACPIKQGEESQLKRAAATWMIVAMHRMSGSNVPSWLYNLMRKVWTSHLEGLGFKEQNVCFNSTLCFSSTDGFRTFTQVDMLAAYRKLQVTQKTPPQRFTTLIARVCWRLQKISAAFWRVAPRNSDA